MNLQSQFTEHWENIVTCSWQTQKQSDLASHLTAFTRPLEDTTGDTSQQVLVPVPEHSNVNRNNIILSLKFSPKMLLF